MTNTNLLGRCTAALFLLIISLQVHAIQGRLVLDSPTPQAGATIRLSYYTTSSPKGLHVALLYYSLKETNSSFARDISVTQTAAGSFTGSFLLPRDAIAFAIRIWSGKAADSNSGKGYIYPVFSGTKPVKGSDAGLALIHAYPGPLGLAEQRDAAIRLFQRALKQYPAESLRFEHHYYRLLTLKYKDSAYPAIERRAMALLDAAHPSAADYLQAMTLYQLAKKFPVADSILKVGSEKFPGSDIAIRQFDKEFNQYDSLPNMLRICGEFTRAFNVNDLSSQAAETYSFWSSFIGYRYLLRKDISNAIYYTGHIITPKLTGYRAFYLDYIAAAMLESQPVDTALVDSLVLAALQSIQSVKEHPADHKFQNETESEFLERFKQETEAPVVDAYATVLALKGKYSEALADEEKVIAIMQWNNPVFNEHYIDYLEKCGQSGTALGKAKLIFLTGNTSPRFRELFQQAYVHENGTDSGFKELLSSMEDPIKKQLRDSLSREQIHAASVPFSIPDMQGHTISLDSLRGKVIVLDFWATWCSPCKAALPTMQRAFDHYRNDTGVVFLFVNTWEVVPPETRLKLINKLISAKNYSFTVLLDKNTNLDSREYVMAGDYGIKGLPTKIIINKHGDIMFRNIGFDNNEDKLFNEIVEMIEMARQ
jgi:thiol-disulfide isomerase/thioredoxin